LSISRQTLDKRITRCSVLLVGIHLDKQVVPTRLLSPPHHTMSASGRLSENPRLDFFV